MKPSCRSMLLLVVVATAASCQVSRRIPPAAARSSSTLTRDSVLAIVAGVRRIGTPEGIDTTLALEVAGTKQWISIRGLNRANPVLLMIHGGPGSPMMPTSWAWQKPWEDFFTVVQWDQRGAGKNFRLADTTADPGPWSIERIVDDGVEVIHALQRILDKEKVVVLGYSWGSMVGVRLAFAHPELLHTYVGVGQAASMKDERLVFDRAMALATAHRNDSAIAQLKALAPYPGSSAPMLQAALAVRHWVARYGGGWYGHQSLGLFEQMGVLAPEYQAEDLAVAGPAARYGGGGLYATMAREDLATVGPFQVPMIFLQGRYDGYTPYLSARAFVESVKAPVKKFITFERSAHFVMLEEPGRFLLTLVQQVLPLTGEAARFEVGADAPRP